MAIDKNTIRTNHPFAAVQIPEFRNLLLGRFLFIMGLRMMSTVLGWWIYTLTNAPLAIGLVGLSEFVPAFGMALYAGHIIDISEKRKLILTGVALYGLAAICLLLLSLTQVHQLTNNTIAIMIYAIVFGTGIVRSFAGPSFNVMLSAIVPKHQLQNATTWNQGAWLLASVTGHALAGFLIALAGNSGSLAVIVSLIILAWLCLWQLQKKPAIAPKRTITTWDSVKEGLHFVFTTKELLGALSLDLFAVLFGGAVAMVPVFARDILKVGPQGFGILNGATDMGAICIVILLTIFPMQRQQGKKLFWAIGGFGLCIIVFAVSKWFWLSFAALLIGGMLDGISVVIRGTIVQMKTPDHMRGRVMSVNSMFINSSNELGQFESGVAARMMGVIPSVVFGGCMTLLVVVFTWFKAPSLRKMEY